jgi:hypothetical protein
MIERIQDVPQGVAGLRLSGRIVASDYRDVVVPLFEQARADDERLRLLIHTADDFEGYTLSGVIADLRVAKDSLADIDRVALVTDRPWVRKMMRTTRMLVPYDVEIYDEASLEDAARWLARTRENGAIPHHVEQNDVLVVEPERPLRHEDIGALEAAADEMIDGGGLSGVVVHAKALPGWDSLGSLWRHVRFARDHAGEVHRVAIAADGPLANLAPRVAGLLVNDIEVSRFAYDDLAEAVSWAHDRPAARN